MISLGRRALGPTRALGRPTFVYLLLVGYALAVLLRGSPHWIGEWWIERPLEPRAAAAGVNYAFVAASVVALAALATCAFLFTAALIAARPPRSPVRLFVSATLVLRAVGFMGGLTALAAADPGWTGPVDVLRSLDGIFAVLFLFVFPDGRSVPGWTSAVWGAWTVWVTAGVVFPELSPVLTSSAWAPLILGALALSGLAAQVYRYRTVATPHQRLQTKWVAYGIAIYALVFVITNVVKVALPETQVAGTPASFTFIVVSSLADDLAASLAAATIAIAVLRRRLLDIDVIANRTLVYLATTGIVAGIFAAVSVGIRQLVLEFSGQRSVEAEVLAALAVGASFGAVKAYVQSIVDKRLR